MWQVGPKIKHASVVIAASFFVGAMTVPAAYVKPSDDPAFTLKTHCPPSFHLTEDNSCQFSNMYMMYKSLENVGTGGLRKGIPDPRDGFTPQEIDLGRYLFFDPALSKDGSMSCASCHDPDMGFADNRARSIGVTGEEVSRSAPTLWNSSFLNIYFWDGRAASYEEQMLGPLYAENEMGNTREHLLETLNGIPEYIRLFKQVYDSDGISLDQVYTALAAFEGSLISLNSRYDQYAHGYHAALSEKEIAGLNVFRSFVARCAECHTPPLFTNQQIAVIGTPEPEGMRRDIGAEAVDGDKTLRGGFKVPTLRNITKTTPYMHSGRFETLRDAIEFYNKGRGHAVGKDEELEIHWHIHEPDLTDDELDLIVAFLGTLTDENFKPETPKSVPSGLPLAPASANDI